MPRYVRLAFLLLALSAVAFCGSKTATKRPLAQTADKISSFSPRTVNPLLGLSSMVAQALPPTNSDGTLNQSRQDAAVQAAVDSLVRNGLIAPPDPTITVDDMKYFAVLLTRLMNNYKDVQVTSPILVWLKAVVKSNTSSSGTVNWSDCTATSTCVQGDVNDLVAIAMSGGQVRLDPGVTQAQLQAFAFDLAKIVDAYNRAGY